MTRTVDLSGRKALVTGASRGIGRAVALALGEAGADVALVATRAERVSEAVAEIEGLGRRALAFGADVADFSRAGEVVGETVERFGGLDILVNNAGVTRDGLCLRMSEEDWDRVLAVNLKGCFNYCRAAARPLMRSKAGRIVNVTSIVGLTGNAGQANYAAAKAGIVGLTKSLAKEFGSRGVCVNALAPGFIETDMTRSLSDDVRARSLERVALGRFGEASDVADAALFLCSDLSRYVTGQVLVVDGGMAG